MIKKVINAFIKLSLYIVVIYSVFWYMYGQYVKSYVPIAMAEILNHKVDISHGASKLSGYPFKFQCKFENFTLTTPGENEKKIHIEEFTLSSDIQFKNLKINIDNSINISSRNNKLSHMIRWENGSHINISCSKSLLEKLLLDRTNRLDISSVSYFDSGYNVFDKNIDKIIFISLNNKIKFTASDNINSLHYKLSVNMDGQGGYNAPLYLYGENALNLDASYEIQRNTDQKKLSIKQLKLNAERYLVEASGSILLGRNDTSEDDSINVAITNFPYIVKILEVSLGSEKAHTISQLLLNANQNTDDIGVVAKYPRSVCFAIRDTNNGIRYGNIGNNSIVKSVIDLAMQRRFSK